MKSLEHEIAKLNANLVNLPSEVKKIFIRSIGDLPPMNLIEKSIQVGSEFSEYSLLNKENKRIELDVNYTNRFSIDVLRGKL